MANVNLYQYPQVVQISQPGAISSASVMNRSDFSIFKSVDNDVDFLIKTYDNKPVDLTNKTITIYIVDNRDQSLKIQQELSYSPMMAKKGHARLTLLWSVLANLDPGYFFYSISVTDSTGKETLFYTDLSRTVQGYLELQQGPLPGPYSSILITESDFASQSWGTDLTVSNYLMAGVYPGAAQRGNRNGMHHVAVYMQNYTGYLNIQASLENSPPTDQHEWFDVDIGRHEEEQCERCPSSIPAGQCPHYRYSQPIYKFTSFTGIKHFSFVGSYMWLQFILNHSPMNYGNVTKILLKN
jgi:hypothetical protein